MNLIKVAFQLSILATQVPQSNAHGCDPTSLEVAINKAFNALVEDGTYAKIFDGLANVKAGSFCSGDADNWPTPEAEKGSDLKRVLRQNKFICGYNGDQTYLTSEGQVLLDTTGGQATGPLVKWWSELGKRLGELYGRKNIDVEWDISFSRSQETLDALQSGKIDAACARWGQDGFWTNEAGEIVPRALALSSQHCITYLEEQQIYTLKTSGTTSFSDLVTGINSGKISSVCTVGSVGGGTTQSCTAILGQYVDIVFSCSGESSEAFPMLEDGSCDAVWGGGPDATDAKKFISFGQPTIYAAGTYFRRNNKSERNIALPSPPLRG